MTGNNVTMDKLVRLLSVLTLALLVITGCAGGSSVKQQAEAKDQTCTYERVTGSNMKKRICRTSSQIESQEKVAQKAIQSVTRR
jgi:hypothetical protein